VLGRAVDFRYTNYLLKLTNGNLISYSFFFISCYLHFIKSRNPGYVERVFKSIRFCLEE
jgi:hypothetical protein